MQACRVLSTDEIRMHCMTAPWRPVAPNASPRCVMRLADLFLLVVADRLWVADRVESLASWPPGRAGGRAAGGAHRCTPLKRPRWPGGGRVALDAPPSQCPNCGEGGDRGHYLSRTPGHGICTVNRHRVRDAHGTTHADVVCTTTCSRRGHRLLPSLIFSS